MDRGKIRDEVLNRRLKAEKDLRTAEYENLSRINYYKGKIDALKELIDIIDNWEY